MSRRDKESPPPPVPAAESGRKEKRKAKEAATVQFNEPAPPQRKGKKPRKLCTPPPSPSPARTRGNKDDRLLPPLQPGEFRKKGTRSKKKI